MVSQEKCLPDNFHDQNYIDDYNGKLAKSDLNEPEDYPNPTRRKQALTLGFFHRAK